MLSILLVSNDEKYCERTVSVLSYHDYIVLSAQNAEEAGNVIHSIKVGLILFDINLGYEAALALSGGTEARTLDEATPLMVLVDTNDPAILVKVVKDGLAGMVSKADGEDALIERLKVLTGSIARRPAASRGRDRTSYSFSRDRDWFESMLVAEWGYSRQNETPVSLMMLAMEDIDNLVAVHGRDVIDGVMNTVELIIRAEVSSRDTVARFDKGVVGLVLAETQGRKAIVLAARLRKVLENTEFGNVNWSFRPSFTTGISAQEGGEIRGWTELKQEALDRMCGRRPSATASRAA